MTTRPVVLWLICFCWCCFAVEATDQRLVIVLFGGMRWDYIARDFWLKAFQRIAKEGVTVQYVTPIFPSKSYPNRYTIVTGLYAESHGMIGNSMYDAVRMEMFDVSPGRKSYNEHWWNKTEPLWVTAEKNGVKTAMHCWDGCQVVIGGMKPVVCDGNKPFLGWSTIRSDTIKKLEGTIDWFETKEENRLALVYYQGTDKIGHKYGPDSMEIKQEIRAVDNIVELFLKKLDNSKLKDEVNLMIVSDHGMADIRKSEVIRVDDLHINNLTKLFLGGGSYGAIWPNPGQEEEVYRILKERNVEGLTVYRRQEIPERLHYKNGQLTFPILLVADLGFYISEPGSKINTTTDKAGAHGYDPYVLSSPMRTTMFAKGPAFKRGVVGDPIEQTDHYNLFCHILGIKALPNNGSWERISKLLVSPEDKGNTGSYVKYNITLVLALLHLALCTER